MKRPSILATLAIGAICAICALPSRASAAPAPRTFDLTTYTAPDGFTVDDSAPDHAMVARIGTKSYCVIAIYTGTAATGDLDASFATVWSAVTTTLVAAVAQPATSRADMPGGRALMAGAVSTMQGKPVFVLLTVVDAGAKVVPIVVLTPSVDDFKIYLPFVQSLLASISVRRVEPTAPAAAQPPAPPPATTVNGKPDAPPPPTALTLADLAGEWNEDDQAITNYVSTSTGAYSGFSAVQMLWKLTISAKGTVDTETRAVQTSSAGAAFTNEKHHAEISVKPDGTIHVHVKAGEGNDWDYLIRGWMVTPDVTILKVVGPYYTIGVPDAVRKNPTYGVVQYFVRKNKPSK